MVSGSSISSSVPPGEQLAVDEPHSLVCVHCFLRQGSVDFSRPRMQLTNLCCVSSVCIKACVRALMNGSSLRCVHKNLSDKKFSGTCPQSFSFTLEAGSTFRDMRRPVNLAQAKLLAKLSQKFHPPCHRTWDFTARRRTSVPATRDFTRAHCERQCLQGRISYAPTANVSARLHCANTTHPSTVT